MDLKKTIDENPICGIKCIEKGSEILICKKSGLFISFLVPQINNHMEDKIFGL